MTEYLVRSIFGEIPKTHKKSSTLPKVLYFLRKFDIINNSKKSRTWLGDEAEPSLILEGEKVINNYSGKEIGKVEDGIIKLHAKTLFDLIIENAHATADPGLLLGFNANKDSFLKGAFY